MCRFSFLITVFIYSFSFSYLVLISIPLICTDHRFIPVFSNLDFADPSFSLNKAAFIIVIIRFKTFTLKLA